MYEDAQMNNEADMVAAQTFDTENTAKEARYNKRTVLLSSVALGAAAFLCDLVPGTLGTMLLTLTSSGLAWGMVALTTGFRQNTWRAAVLGSTATLLIATVVYYAMVLGVSQRWRGGNLQDGSSADFISLLSVGRAAAFWAIASLCAGPLLGTIGWKMRVGSERQSSILIAASFGLFSAESFDALVLRASLREHLQYFGQQFMQPAFLTIALSALATSYLLWRRKIRFATVTFIASAFFSVALGILLWRFVSFARVLISV
ncbi:hypothetical protein QLQ12_46450 [Actinoplanes sp. NEAU-A12]|uniref:Uncharacterized protein n=1 Tax=Actinoplanes sandaracinus TaxID=3045177 RepID=A0ABT6X1X1_9ACTN|nr:hypothetical protein [Actinoplanes sandaracinus]MDI6106031.1 hypothetical protein [Actinoplanes sandaracinus]